MLLRKLAIRLILPLTWRPSRKRTAAQLQRFSVTEADSGWQILYALDAIDDPALRCKVLQHAMEEVHHACEFNRVSLPYTAELPRKLLCRRDPIFLREKGVDGLITFVAYAEVGEKDVFDQFDSYAGAIGGPAARSVFLEAKKDEEGHIGLCHGILLGLVGTEEAAARKIRMTRLRRIYETWKRGGKAIGDTMLALILTTVFAVGGLLLTLTCRKRLSNSYTHANRLLEGKKS